MILESSVKPTADSRFSVSTATRTVNAETLVHISYPLLALNIDHDFLLAVAVHRIHGSNLNLFDALGNNYT